MAAATEITFNFWGRHGSHGLLRRTPHILRPAFCARDSRYAARLITIKQSLMLYEVQKQAASRRAPRVRQRAVPAQKVHGYGKTVA